MKRTKELYDYFNSKGGKDTARHLGEAGKKQFSGLVGEYLSALEDKPTDEGGYTKAIERIEKAKVSLERNVGANNKHQWWRDIYDDLTPSFDKRIGELQGDMESYRIGKFKDEARGAREIQSVDLENSLSAIADREFNTLFKPQIRESLNARGIMGGGAEKEVGAATQGKLRQDVSNRKLQYDMDTENFDQSLGLEQVMKQFGARREDIVAGYSDILSGASNALSMELANITRPGFIDYFTNAAQIAGLYGQYKGTGSGGSGGGGGSIPQLPGLANDQTEDPNGAHMSPRYSKASAGTQGGLGNKFDSGPAV